MSKMYKLEDGVILREGVGIASYENGEVDFFSGMAKYRMPVTKWLKKAVKAPKVVKNVKKEPKPVLKEVIESVSRDNWLEYLIAICGCDIPKPHSVKGWKGTKYRDILMKNYNNILKSEALTSNEKKAIINQFI